MEGGYQSMSTTIDQKVVEMRFDNRHFEQNVSTTMSTLDKLKQRLDLTGSAKGLTDLGYAAKKVDMNPLANGVETVRMRFSALQIMGVTALQNITNEAVNTGKRMLSALTVDPIKTGFSEYELKMNSVQTIMASTGESIDTVNEYLEELNKYSDQTIYSFSDMTQNIGKFTNAGVKLEDAVAAIKGISNEAAVSGANANEASRAMYNFAQALSAGYVKLIDWKSIENANMATVEFKNQLIETALSLGTVSDAGDGMYETLTGKTFNATSNFNDVLQEQWMTSEVLIETLKKYADETTEIGSKASKAATEVKTFTQLWDTLKESAQSGWAKTWELLVGDLLEAKKLLTGISKTVGGFIDAMSDWRNGILEKALGSPFKGMTKALDDLTKPVKTVTDNLEELDKMANRVIRGDFGNGEERVRKLTELGWNYAKVQNLVNEKLGCSVRIDESKYETQKNTDKAQKDNIETLLQLSDTELKAAGCTEEEIEALRELGKYAEKTGIPIKELVKDLDQLSGRNLLINALKNIWGSDTQTDPKKALNYQGILGVLSVIKEAWQNIFPPKSVEDRAKGVYDLIAAFHKFTTNLSMSGDTVEKLRRTFEGLFASIEVVLMLTGGPLKWAFKVLVEILKMFDLDILDVTAGIGDMAVEFRNWLKESNLVTAALEKLTPIIIGMVTSISDFIKKADFGGWLSKAKHAILDWLTGLQEAENVPKYLIDSLINGIKNGVPNVIKAVKYLGELLLNQLKKISGFDEWLEGFIGGDGLLSRISKWFSGIKDADNIGKYIIQGLVNGLITGADAVFDTIIEIAKKLIENVCTILGIHSPSTVFFDIGKNIILGLINGVKFMMSAAWDIFTSLASKVVEMIKGLDFGQVFVATIGVGMVAGVWKLLDTTKNISTAIKSIVSPLEGLGEFLDDAGDAVRDFGKGFKRHQTAEALKDFAIAIAILTASVIALTFVNQDKIWGAVTTIAALAGVILVIGFAASLISKVGTLDWKTVLWLVGISAAMLVMAKVFTTLAGIDVDNALKVVGGFALMIAGLLITVKLMAKFTQNAMFMDKTGVFLIKMAIAMALMVGVVKLASGIDKSEVKQAAYTIALIGALFMAMTAVSEFAGEHAKSAGKMLWKMSLSMLLMVGVVKLAAGLDPSEARRGLEFVSAVAALFAGVLVISRLGKDGAGKIGLMLLEMSVAMLLMVAVIKQIDKMDADALRKGLTVVTMLSGIFAVLIAVSHFAGAHAAKAGAMLLAMSTAMVVLVGLTLLLGMMDPKKMLNGLVAISVFSGCMALLIASTKNSRVSKEMRKTLTTFVIAVGILTALMIALTFLDPRKIAVGTAAITLIMGSFALLLASTGKAKNTKPAMRTIWSMTAIVVALAGVISLMSLLDQKSVLSSSAALSIMLLSFTAAFAILGKSKTKTMGKNAWQSIGSMVLVMYAIGALLAAMSLLTLIPGIDINAMPVMAASLGIAILSLTAALSIIGKAKMPDARNVGKMAKVMFALSGAMLIIGAVLAAMSLITLIPGVDIKAMPIFALSLGIAIASLAVAMQIIGEAKVPAKGSMGRITGAMFILAAVMVPLGLILAMMTALKVKKAIPNAMALSLMLVALAGVAVLIGTIGKSSKGLALGSLCLGILAGVMAALGLVLAMMTALDIRNALENATVLSGLLVVLAGVGSVMAIFGGLAKAMALGSLCLGILAGVMAALVVVLHMMNVMNITNAVENASILAALLIVLTGIAVIMSAFGWLAMGITMGAGAMFSLVAVMASLGLVLKLMEVLNLKDAEKNAKLIIEMMGSLTAICVALALVGPMALVGVTALAALEALVIATGVVAAALGALAMIPGVQDAVDKGIPLMIQLAEGLGNMLGAFLGGTVAGFATSSLEKLAQSLSKFMDDMQPFIDKISNVGGDVWDGAKNLTGAILALTAADLINGIVSMLDNSESGQGLPALGTELSEFMKNADGFISGAEKLADSKIVEAAKGLAGVVLALTGAGVLEGLTSLFGGESSITKFGEGLPVLGNGIGGFYKSLVDNGFTTDGVPLVEAAANALSKITAVDIPNTGGLLGWVMGNNDIDDYGSRLSSFATSFGDFLTSIRDSGITEADVGLATLVANAVSKITAIDIPNTGGFLGWVMGNNDIDDYGTRLSSFATSFGEFITTVRSKGITEADVGLATLVANAVSAIAAVTVPRSGGFLDWVLGSDDIGTFGTHLAELGNGIGSFVTSLNTSGFSSETSTLIDSAVSSIRSLATLARDFDDSIWEKFTGTGMVGAFNNLASCLPTLGSAFASFATNSTSVTDGTVGSLRMIFDAISLILGLDSVEIGEASRNLNSLGTMVKSFSEKLDIFCDNMTADVLTAIGTAKSVVAELQDFISGVEHIDASNALSLMSTAQQLGSSIANNFASAINKVETREDIGESILALLEGGVKRAASGSAVSQPVKNSASYLCGDIVAELANALKTDIHLETIGLATSRLVDKVVTTFTDVAAYAVDTSEMVATLASHIKTTWNYNTMASAGGYLVDGFAAGITENMYKAEAEAAAMATAAKEAAEAALGIESPSKVFYEIGKYTVDGFINALSDYAGSVSTEAYGFGSSAINGFNQAISDGTKLLSMDGVDQPTIKPVVDLTEVKTGADAIASMMSSNASIGVSANVDSVSNLMQNRQNGGEDLLTAINKLTTKLEGIRGDSYVINEVNYTEDDGVVDAFQTIIQAARIERRS
jgi:hypothetical protein